MNSARSRANSEHDIAQQFRTDKRPNSSHENRKPLNEERPTNPVAVNALSDRLGIDLKCEPNLHWIVKDCLAQLGEAGWYCDVLGSGDVEDLVLIHRTSGEKRGTHDIIHMHEELGRRIRHEHEVLEAKRSSVDFRIKELVYHRLKSVTDSRIMATPSLINQIIEYLGIEVMAESYLARIVKEELDASFFRMVKQGGPNHVTVDNCFNVNDLQARIALTRVAYTKACSETKLLFCVDCRNTLADGICATCAECLCACCHSRSHSCGSRMDHLFVFIDQCVCAECSSHAAEIRCVDCADLFCTTCFKSTHQKGKRVKHCIQLPTAARCMNCDFKEADGICLDCKSALCRSCTYSIHKFVSSMNHFIHSIRDVAYARKLFACNADALFDVITKCFETRENSNWYIFYDEHSEPYWYNFYSGQTIGTTMRNISVPPTDTQDQEDEIKRVTRATAMRRALTEIPARIEMQFRQASD